MKKVTCSYIGEHFLFPIKEFEEKIIKHNPKLIFICNPNNPTGTVLSAQEIIQLANINKNSLIVVDELYEKFNGDSLLELINFENSKNIVIIQSLSIAGIISAISLSLISVYFDVELNKGKEFNFKLPSTHNTFIYLINGEKTN